MATPIARRASSAPPVRPGATFFIILGATFALGAYLYRAGDAADPVAFAFVLVGWVLSLTFHEFGHALAAWIGGDRSVAEKGYLTLDPRRYTEPGLSILLPVLFVVMGGIGLPGGAVWINHGAIPSRWSRSIVSVAGPAANVVFAVLCFVPVGRGWVTLEDHRSLAFGLAFLGSLQVAALLLNLIPVPGLDGYGIIEPHLSNELRLKLRPIAQYGIFVVIAALWFVDPVADAFWGVVRGAGGIFGVDNDYVVWGYREFQFWR